MSLFKDGEFKVGKGDTHFSLDYKDIRMMKIKGNDLYLEIRLYLIKISDFQSKFAVTAK
ncbi:hypothetical protein ACHRVW_22375 [Flavobacterium collinsii]|uniref:hypothetical protein n=1 Tax=Flavobacterium collinsii TaxID=1114861 RepID=UPI00249365FD|nr:hypothetical protein [Flavobacterium collinsii]